MSEGWNILVVDDEPPIRAELRYLLEKDTRVGQIAEAGNVTEILAEYDPDSRSRFCRTSPTCCF